MPIITVIGEAADAAGLLAGIRVQASGSGFWATEVIGSVIWFTSFAGGSSGCTNPVFAFGPSGVQLQAFVGADFDGSNVFGGGVAGFVNDDTLGTDTKITPSTDPGTAWAPTPAGPWFYVLVIDEDCITVLVRALGGSGRQIFGILTGGTPQPIAGSRLQEYACAKIFAIDSSVPAATVITLDADINAALKDTYNDDLYVQAPLFQSVGADAAHPKDFAVAQRIPINAGSLTLGVGPSGEDVTQFTINATVFSKLTGAVGRRYRDGRGVGDLVRLEAQPTLAMAFAADNGSTGAAAHVLCSHDAMGGQSAAVFARLANALCDRIIDKVPAAENGLPLEYPLYAVVEAEEHAIIPQADHQGRSNVGAHRHLHRSSTLSAALYDLNQCSFRAMRFRTCGTPAGGEGFVSTDATGGPSTFYAGPGWQIDFEG